jgi:hypothetical protein
MRELFDWTVQTMQLIRQIRERLAITTKAWTRFTSAKGDRGYFEDICDRGSLLELDSLMHSFQVLEDLQQDLESLDRSCEESRVMVSHQYKYHFFV